MRPWWAGQARPVKAPPNVRAAPLSSGLSLDHGSSRNRGWRGRGWGGQGDFPGARSLLQEMAAASGLEPSVSSGSLEVATCHLTGHLSLDRDRLSPDRTACHLAAQPWPQGRALPPAPSPRPSSLDAARGALSPPSRPASSGTERAWRTLAQEESSGRTGMWGSAEDDRRAEQPGHRTSQATSILRPMATADCPAPPPNSRRPHVPARGSTSQPGTCEEIESLQTPSI